MMTQLNTEPRQGRATAATTKAPRHKESPFVIDFVSSSLGGCDEPGDVAATLATRAQRHNGVHKDNSLVSDFVSSCLGGCDGLDNVSEAKP